MPLTIRQMLATDINSDFFQSLGALSNPDLTVEEAQIVFLDRVRKSINTYIAVLDGRIVGTCSLLVERKFLHKGGKVGHIEDVAVHPDHQRRGIGTALVGHAEAEARREGCYKLILDCFDHLQPFYAKTGYRKYSIQMRKDL